MEDKLEFRCFDESNKEEFSKFRKLIPKELDNVAFMQPNYKYYYLVEKIMFRDVIIGYSKIADLSKFSSKEKIFFSKVINTPIEMMEIYNIFIEDFMIRRMYRRRGYGTILAKYILNEIYKDRNIVLTPNGDGYEFWPTLGFKQIEIDSKDEYTNIYVLEKIKL